MNKEQRKLLRQEYDQRRPEKGIVCWKSGERMWIAKSENAKTDYNSSLFKLKLGSFPNREMQDAYKKDPDSFEWSLLKKLDYKKRDDDHSEDLELLYMICMEEYPEARQMKKGKR